AGPRPGSLRPSSAHIRNCGSPGFALPSATGMRPCRPTRIEPLAHPRPCPAKARRRADFGRRNSEFRTTYRAGVPPENHRTGPDTHQAWEVEDVATRLDAVLGYGRDLGRALPSDQGRSQRPDASVAGPGPHERGGTDPIPANAGPRRPASRHAAMAANTRLHLDRTGRAVVSAVQRRAAAEQFAVRSAD